MLHSTHEYLYLCKEHLNYRLCYTCKATLSEMYLHVLPYCVAMYTFRKLITLKDSLVAHLGKPLKVVFRALQWRAFPFQKGFQVVFHS